MKNSDVIKSLLFAAVNEIAADPGKYAVNPGRDFTRNRKMGFHDTLLLLLTMEADCIKEELYRYFGRNTDAPSKPAFYKQRKKLTSHALANLLFTFNGKLSKIFSAGNTNSLPATVLLLTFSETLTIPTLFLSLTANPQGALTRSTLMPFTPSSTGALPIS